MNMSKNASTNATTKVSPFVLLIIILTLVLSLTALIIALSTFESNVIAAGWLTLIGALGVGISTYVLLQARRRTQEKIATPPTLTTVECTKCGFKNVREFQRGDYIFKEAEKCEKCGNPTQIAAIYREVKEGHKERYRF
jgi:hypothetical protein